MSKKLVLTSIRSLLGNWVYYSSVMTAKQIKDWVVSAKEIRESKELDEILQRDLKENRIEQIKNYLINNENRFFNSIIIGVYGGIPEWIEFDIDKKFSELDEEVNKNSSIGILIFESDEKMFAIDGQHRVAGIHKLYEKHSSEDENITNDEFFPVIFLAHIDDEDGKRRTRRLFSDINKNAKPVPDGDKIKIDEDDLNSIVTRIVYSKYKYFTYDNKRLISLTEQANLDTKNKKDFDNFTNLLALNTVNKKLRVLFKKKKNSNENDKENIENFQKVVFDFYDFIIENINDYKYFFINHTFNLKEARENNKNLLFRPVGLVLLAKLYALFKKKNKLEILKNNINKISFIFPESPLNNIIWNNGKMETKEKNQKLSLDLVLYLLNEYEGNNEDLLERYKDITKNKEAKLPNKIL